MARLDLGEARHTSALAVSIEPLSVLIVGAGVSGIGMGIALRKAGIRDFAILEKASASGGVWRDNTYPGAACDIPSPLYSFSFERRYHWSRMYSSGGEIDRYLRYCIDKYELASQLRYQVEVKAAHFDERHAQWRIDTASGEIVWARSLIMATGQLSRPAWPDIHGLHDYRGTIFHTARWDHRYALKNKEVAVIGTGASAIQIVPRIADKVAKLYLFQRSAPYVIPKFDHAISRLRYALFDAVPLLYGATRAIVYWAHELYGIGLLTPLRFGNLAVRLAAFLNLRLAVRDRQLRRKLTPDYQLGCKRVLVANDYYPALVRSNVQLVTSGIRAISSGHIETVGGESYRVDAIILATGFRTTEMLEPIDVQGRGGARLRDTWHRSASAYLGMTVPEFPNMFILYGPNTNVAHNSVIYMIESQIRYVVQAVQLLRETPGRCMAVKESVYAAFNRHLQQKLRRSPWTTGCRNWYVNEGGKVVNNWSGFTFTYRYQTRRVRAADYEWSDTRPPEVNRNPAGSACDGRPRRTA